MFQSAEQGRAVPKGAYKRRLPTLRLQLLEAQRSLREQNFPALVLISGVDGAGKGDVLNLLNEWLDPRQLQAHAPGVPTEEERERPFYWRFWRTLPAAGTIGLYVGSWYSHPLSQRLYGALDETSWDQRLERIRAFERLLADDGALIVKFWLHLSKAAQQSRFHRLAQDPDSAWRVTGRDREHLALYDAFRPIAEQALRATDTPWAPWSVIDAEDPRHRNLAVGEGLLAQLTGRLAPARRSVPQQRPGGSARTPDRLRALDLSRQLAKPDYKRQLAHWQGRLGMAAREAVRQKRSSIVVFEGWDAAGKGGIIRRILPALDARFYRVISVGAPTDEEQAHHYLWRFWRHIPRAGRTTIYDRSWYGRVLVERVEQLASEAQWGRAYGEINDFETQLAEAGIVLVKFWVHISRAEQLNRFRKRERTPFKRYKISAEDYRNRAHWGEYEQAVNDMLARTDTAAAPWTLVEGEDKRFARIKALRHYCERLESALG